MVNIFLGLLEVRRLEPEIESALVERKSFKKGIQALSSVRQMCKNYRAQSVEGGTALPAAIGENAQMFLPTSLVGEDLGHPQAFVVAEGYVNKIWNEVGSGLRSKGWDMNAEGTAKRKAGMTGAAKMRRSWGRFGRSDGFD